MNKSLLDILYQRNLSKRTDDEVSGSQIVIHIEGKDYPFESKKAAKRFQKEVDSLLKTDHAEVFLEEPESNLFPPTQFQLMNWIVEMGVEKKHKNFFFIATHSPYILSHLLQENLQEFKLFLTYPSSNGGFNVKSASEEEIQQIYDNGSDAFFNFDAFTN